MGQLSILMATWLDQKALLTKSFVFANMGCTWARGVVTCDSLLLEILCFKLTWGHMHGRLLPAFIELASQAPCDYGSETETP